MSLAGRALSIVRLHTPVHVSGMGNMTNTIKETHKTKDDTSLTYLEDGNILLKTKEGVEAVLFAANIISAELKPVASKTAKVVGFTELPDKSS